MEGKGRLTRELSSMDFGCWRQRHDRGGQLTRARRVHLHLPHDATYASNVQSHTQAMYNHIRMHTYKQVLVGYDSSCYISAAGAVYSCGSKVCVGNDRPTSQLTATIVEGMQDKRVLWGGTMKRVTYLISYIIYHISHIHISYLISHIPYSISHIPYPISHFTYQ